MITDRCKRCKRLIKNPVSIVHGYGPSCWRKISHIERGNKGGKTNEVSL
jgi:hypothetical protein